MNISSTTRESQSEVNMAKRRIASEEKTQDPMADRHSFEEARPELNMIVEELHRILTILEEDREYLKSLKERFV